MDRREATEAVRRARLALGLQWREIAARFGRSEVWTTAAALGQAELTAEEAGRLGEILELDPETIVALTLPPLRGADCVDLTDPLVYRLSEMIQVYGETIQELVREEFGDGIVSAIDFEFDIARREDPKGDRVIITLNGKFLPYRKW